MKPVSLFDKKYYQMHEFVFSDEDRSDHRCILRLLAPKKTDRVLEIGCGFGVLLKKILAKKKIGIEVNDITVERCRKNGLTVIKADAEKKLLFKNSSFDIIIMNEVISHLEKPEAALKECFRILKNGGKILLTAPVRSFFFHDISPTHVSEMNVRELRSLVEEGGFKIVTHEVCGISFLYPFFEFFFFKPFRLLRFRLGKKEVKGAKTIDSLQRFADNALLKRLGSYRSFLLGFGSNQIILAKKIPILV